MASAVRVNYAPLAPALEKAFPQHRNLMGKVYRAISGNGMMPDIKQLDDDLMERIVDVIVAVLPDQHKAVHFLLRWRYGQLATFVRAVEPKRAVTMYRKRFDLRAICVPKKWTLICNIVGVDPMVSSQSIVSEHLDCVMIHHTQDKLWFIFDNDAASVRTRLQLSDIIMDTKIWLSDGLDRKLVDHQVVTR